MAGADNESAGQESQDAVVLPEDFTIALAGEYYQLMMNQLEEGHGISLDGGSVSRIDASGIQLLVAVQRALAEAGHSLHWNSVSAALSESVALLGMSDVLALPEPV